MMMEKTMRAAVVTQFRQPLEVREVPVPRPGRGQILIRVHACGVCHTDLHAVNGDWPDKPPLPRIPGHEVIGEIVEVGEGVDYLNVGERVGVPWLHWACGTCEQCLSGWETLCTQQQRTGYEVDGGFAEYMVASGHFATKIPVGIDDLTAAPLVCAGLTVYKGLMMTSADPGDWVIISGIGGLGHLAVQYGKAMGFQVIAVDIEDEKLDLASKLGAAMTVNPRNTDPVGYLQRQIGGAHAALVTAVSPPAFGQAVGMMRPGGTVVLNGLPPGDFPLSIYDMVMRAITLRGSIVGTRFDLGRALHLAAQEKIIPTVHTAKLDDINEVLENMQTSSLPGRTVLELG
ncbi:alcohol dehydrogenase AdhP [Propionimicrobium sp. PCR01-08-3]|uniref:alcohol dehydrogenase AdhP n=1 Tax=Propionimicrobium sp. PCR01-08-3 TaxID=3052086 RepID=UPI003340AEFA